MQDVVIPQDSHSDKPAEAVSRSPRLATGQPLQSSGEYPQYSFLAVVYSDPRQASRVLKALQTLKSPKLTDLDEAVYVTRDKRGRTLLQEPRPRRKKNIIGDSVVGMMAGAILLAPIDGSSLVEATDTVRRKVANVSLEDEFVRTVRARMEPDSSTIFLLIQRVRATEIIPRITPYGGTMLETSITRDERIRLAALEALRTH